MRKAVLRTKCLTGFKANCYGLPGLRDEGSWLRNFNEPKKLDSPLA